MWLYVTDDRRKVDALRERVLAPMLSRTVDELRSVPLPVGPAAACAEILAAYATAGAERVFLWPLADEARQLELVRERVVPLL
jgi:alkanesulfonate monooxygenase SsuD/methylene tetrahydromethanopterin reductase-like flavin-dependent oxidoreductase (luciferase family)